MRMLKTLMLLKMLRMMKTFMLPKILKNDDVSENDENVEEQ
jgi:hypothetical protein